MVDSFFDSLPDHLTLIMNYVPVLITIAFPIAIYVTHKRIQNETVKAKETANRLGLKYINVADETVGDQKGSSFLSKIFSGWSPWAMNGKYNGMHVRIELIKNTSHHRISPSNDSLSESNPTRTSYSTWTKYEALFKTPLIVDVFIRRRFQMGFGFPSPSETDEVMTGDKELDKMIIISGRDNDQIQGWLSSNHVKKALMKIFHALPATTIDSKGIYLQDQIKKSDYAHIHNNLGLLTETVKKFQKY